MGILFDAPVVPDSLTTFVRQVPTLDVLTLLNAFPTQNVQDNRVDFAAIVAKNRTARYRSFDGRIHVSQRNAGSTSFVNLPPLSSSLNMGEYERLQLEFARTGGTYTDALAAAIYNDATGLTREVQRRLEQAWGDVLSDGILTVSEIDGGFTADFGVPSNQKVSPSTVWSTVASATVLSDIISWVDVYVATNGVAPAFMRTSLATLRYVQRNTELIDAIYGAQTGKTRIALQDLNDFLAGEGLPQFRAPYDYQVVDDSGSGVRTMAANIVTFEPADLSELGYTAWGISATALELVNANATESELSFEEAPGITGVVIKEGPPFRQFTFVDAVAMPILEDANKLMIATVS